VLLRQLAKTFGFRDHLVIETDLAVEREIRKSYDFEPLIQFRVLPEELSLCLSEFRMVLVQVNLRNLGGHACCWLFWRCTLIMWVGGRDLRPSRQPSREVSCLTTEPLLSGSGSANKGS